MNLAESQLQQQCVYWFRHEYPEYDILYGSVPNGADVPESNRIRLAREGLVRGWSDTLLLVPSHDGRYHFLAIEYKRKVYTTRQTKSGVKLYVTHTSQSEDQRKFQERIEKVGGKYAVIWDFQDFKNLIKEYLGR